MEPYDAEFRGEVLAACDTNEERRLIALRFKVSESWLRRIQQQRRETGHEVVPETCPACSQKAMDRMTEMGGDQKLPPFGRG